jgi:dTDP-4-dehydrorhamnose reductase
MLLQHPAQTQFSAASDSLSDLNFKPAASRDASRAAASSPTPPLELWGGVECTVNRVGDEFYCQISRSGHAERNSDLDLIASLGVRALRYPVLWEKCAPHGFDSVDWSWPDARLHQLRALNIRPIAGLVHHGSGPRHTSLIDDEFAPGLARWAGLVARRFPWLDAYTPVNEPLTTARFSTLYGFWFPHARDDGSFARAIVNQCRATVLAMREVRKVNPHAQLIQTDDMGEVYSSPGMRYQADFENQRRWLAFDLLCGRIVAGHPMHHFLRWNGISDWDLDWLRDNPCPPDVVGLNHYATSNRFLDEHTDAYPPSSHGSNGRDNYADVEAARVDLPRTASVRDHIVQAWQRYQTPIAITEAHLGCTREEQMRWLHEVWQGALESRREGVPVQAVTAWSLLGAHDWNSVLTRTGEHYEPGAFDIRAPRPRATALVPMLRALASGEEFSHPVLAQRGWWHREGRVLFGSPGTDAARDEMLTRIEAEAQAQDEEHLASTCAGHGSPEQNHEAGGEQVLAPLAPPPAQVLEAEPLRRGESKSVAAPIVIVGAHGTLGRAFSYVCDSRGLECRPLNRFECDIVDPASVRAALDEHRPWAVVNTAGFVRVDDAERSDEERDRCFALNTHGALDLARACAERDINLALFSSDLVFDGTLGRAYSEEDAPNPLNVYGRSKAALEEGAASIHPGALIVRTSAFFGPWDPWNFPSQTLRALEEGREVRAAHDVFVSPTYVPYLAHATLDLLIDGMGGLWHGANVGEVSWFEWARESARRAHVDTSRLVAVAGDEMGWAASRPPRVPLISRRAPIMATLEDAMNRFENEREK